ADGEEDAASSSGGAAGADTGGATGATVGAAGAATGVPNASDATGGAAGGADVNEWLWLSPLIESLNPRMPSPSDRPISGSRFAPNTNRITTSSRRMWRGFSR